MKQLKDFPKETVKLVLVACDIVASYGDYLMFRDDGRGHFIVIGKHEQPVPVEVSNTSITRTPLLSNPVLRLQHNGRRFSEKVQRECEIIVQLMAETGYPMTPLQIAIILAERLGTKRYPKPYYSRLILILLSQGLIIKCHRGVYKCVSPSPVDHGEKL